MVVENDTHPIISNTLSLCGSIKTTNHHRNFIQQIYATFTKFAERPFMSIAHESHDDDSSISQWLTYDDVYQKIISKYVPQLVAYEEGSCIGLFVSNSCMDFYQIQMSCALCKHVTVGLAPTMSNEQLKHILTITKCKALFVLDKKSDILVQRIYTITSELSTQVETNYCNNNDQDKTDSVVAIEKIIPIDQDTYDANDPIFSMVFTSGSTGMPKGVGLTVRRWFDETRVPPPRNHPPSPLVIISFTQPAWYMSQWSVWRAFWCGGQVGFSHGGVRLFEEVRRIEPTIFFAPPVVWNLLYHQYETIAEQTGEIEALKFARIMLGSRITSISTGSAPIAPVVLGFLQHVFADNFQIYDGYGLTETGHILKDGRPQRHVNVKLEPLSDLDYVNVNEENNDYISGELYARTPFMVTSYINDPVESEKAFTTDGWFRTGDVFQLIAPNTYKFVDRIKSFIKTEDGTFVSSSSIECLLLKHHAIQQSFVHSIDGHLVAVVILTEDSMNQEVTSPELMNFVRINHGPTLRAVIIEFEPWTVANGLLTLSMKYARPALLRKYQSAMANAIREQQQSSRIISHPSTHTSTLAWLASAVAKMAGIPIDQLSPTQTIAELGLNSLEAVRFTLNISSAFPTKHIPVSIILNQSLKNIALCIDEPSTDLNHLQVASEFRAESQRRVTIEIKADIDDALLKLASATKSRNVSPISPTNRTAFLTGATGFIGSRMLHDLLTFETEDRHFLFQKVFCLVRAQTADEGINRLIKVLKDHGHWQKSFDDRIVCIKGSLDEANCGISKSDYTRLVDEVTHIYNIAAVVHWRHSYSDLHKANVLGMVDLLHLALSSVPTKYFHQCSTIGVLSNALTATDQLHLAFWRDDAAATCSNTHRHSEYISEDVDIGNDPYVCSQDNGYSQTKWCCDRIITEVKQKQPELDARIYRLGFIGWSLETGIAHKEDFIIRLVTTIIRLGVYPCFSADDAINLSPVEYASACIIGASCSVNSPSSAVPVYNVTNNHASGLGTLTYQRLVCHMQEFGYDNLKQINHTTWISLIAEKPTLPLYPLLFVVVDGFSAAWSLDDTHTRQALLDSFVSKPTHYFSCPAITGNVVHSLLRWMVDQSIIEPPVTVQ